MADQEIGHFNSWVDTFQAWQKTFEIFELTERWLSTRQGTWKGSQILSYI